MEIEIENIEKEEMKKKKGSKKKYLYALGVILVAGLFLGSATHIPIGVQFVTPALSSVSYFFGGGHGGNGLLVYYYLTNGHDLWKAFVHAAYSTGLGIILDYLGVDIVMGLDDVIAAGVKAVATYLAWMFAAYLPWWLGPAVLPYVAVLAAL